MSDSRLEKFIYAICSMDVSDLPVPLSRIEKLWNCLITGETPDFEPLSRNEKYLMAMLDRYDLNNLPAPVSRGEKLLYKISIGETDLSDVPGYLSRYEELLKYLIENGGISGDDFEYVLYTFNQSLYTLYTTAEKPVKSAILKGNTLVNLLNGDNIEQRPSSNTSAICGYDKETRTFHFITNLSHPYSYSYISTYNADKNGVARHLKNNTDYTIMWYGEKIRDDDDSQTFIKVGASSNAYGDPNYFTNVVNIKTGKMLYRTQTSYEDSIVRLLGIRVLNVSNDIEYKLRFVILEGDYTNVDILYFTGMQSVKMPVLTTVGKNTFNIKNKGARRSGWYSIPLEIPFNGEVYVKCADSLPSDFRINLLAINRNEYVLTNEQIKKGHTAYYQNLTDIEFHCPSLSIEGNSRGILDDLVANGDIVIDVGGEPYKSNILSTPEDLELRGFGDVKDELDCLTGEVTQRIGEIVLDGSEEWGSANNADGTLRFNYAISDFKNYGYGSNGKNLINNKLPIIPFSTNSGKYGLTSWSNVLVVFTEHTTLNDFKQWLSKNPITVQYELETESIKTVDLTVVDQDNQPTKLGTFENVTHVSLESAGLIPEVEMEVATHISEELASASPLMDDISTKQEQLNTMVDEQSNNVDATMMATTEIYEQTL